MEGGCSITETKALLCHMESSSVKTKTTPSITLPKDVRNVIEGILFSPSPTLDLSKRGLEILSEDIFKIPLLKQLHLQRNELSVIPKDFFQLLPNLVWLDLRHNKIKAIPSGIGSHKNLKTLLMEKNPIKALPVELGNLLSLKALNLRSCPLEFPPEDVIQKGLVAILAFLRNLAPKQSAASPAPCQEIASGKKASSLKESAPTRQDLARGDDPEQKGYLIPHVEKLDLTDITEPSVGFPEDCPSEEEMRRFWKLRQEIVASEKAELLINQLLPIQLPLSLQTHHAKGRLQKPHPTFRIQLKKSYNTRKKMSSFKNMFPEIPSYDNSLQAAQTKKDEERRVAALKELKEKQALLEQRKRDKKTLQKWREHAEVMKKEKETLMSVQHPPKETVLEKAPFATDEADNKKFSALEKKKAGRFKGPPEQDELRASKDREIEERIKQHMEALRERRREVRGTPQEEMEKAAQDMETAKKLYEDIHKRYQDPNRRKEYRFTAFTGEVNPRLPASQPQNIFFNMKF